jgi:hypothetical protein
MNQAMKIIKDAAAAVRRESPEMMIQTAVRKLKESPEAKSKHTASVEFSLLEDEFKRELAAAGEAEGDDGEDEDEDDLWCELGAEVGIVRNR